jgi:hypothetical protein
MRKGQGPRAKRVSTVVTNSNISSKVCIRLPCMRARRALRPSFHPFTVQLAHRVWSSRLFFSPSPYPLPSPRPERVCQSNEKKTRIFGKPVSFLCPEPVESVRSRGGPHMAIPPPPMARQVQMFPTETGLHVQGPLDMGFPAPHLANFTALSAQTSARSNGGVGKNWIKWSIGKRTQFFER